eukprot:GEMP01118223.1.p1 GENE.GEMP01118223.1~~GEMP01118223.1.p1  ORF type:complete len:124 (-),score=13.15 GEMP01118223.1:56-427(-)
MCVKKNLHFETNKNNDILYLDSNNNNKTRFGENNGSITKSHAHVCLCVKRAPVNQSRSCEIGVWKGEAHMEEFIVDDRYLFLGDDLLPNDPFACRRRSFFSDGFLLARRIIGDLLTRRGSTAL